MFRPFTVVCAPREHTVPEQPCRDRKPRYGRRGRSWIKHLLAYSMGLSPLTCLVNYGSSPSVVRMLATFQPAKCLSSCHCGLFCTRFGEHRFRSPSSVALVAGKAGGGGGVGRVSGELYKSEPEPYIPNDLRESSASIGGWLFKHSRVSHQST